MRLYLHDPIIGAVARTNLCEQTPNTVQTMENKDANAKRGRTMTTMAFRYPVTRRQVLEAIQREKGHAQLSDTLREAVTEYIERHLRPAA